MVHWTVHAWFECRCIQCQATDVQGNSPWETVETVRPHWFGHRGQYLLCQGVLCASSCRPCWVSLQGSTCPVSPGFYKLWWIWSLWCKSSLHKKPQSYLLLSHNMVLWMQKSNAFLVEASSCHIMFLLSSFISSVSDLVCLSLSPFTFSYSATFNTVERWSIKSPWEWIYYISGMSSNLFHTAASRL